MGIKILLADDHTLVRSGLRSLLDGYADAEVVGEAQNGRSAVRLVRELRPDVVLMDIAMPDLNGMDATRQIRDEFPTVQVIGLSMHSDRQFVTGMLKAGAAGYLLKNCEPEELRRAIGTVAAGQCYVDPRVAGGIVKDVIDGRLAGEASVYDLLTEREREVLQLLAEGRTSKQIAEKLHVSLKTVDTHRAHVMDKLGIRNVAELTKYAIRHGLTSVDR